MCFCVSFLLLLQGVVHKGSLSCSRQVLSPYLPGPQSNSPHAEGGALYALGLIHAAKGHANNGEIVSYITTALEATSNEVRRRL